MFSVIFEVRPAAGKRDAYLNHAKELKPAIETIDGFVDNERFESRDRPGWVLSHSTWRDEKSVIRWRTQAKHHLIQEKGRFEIFSDYHLRVGEITADTHPPQGMALRQQRFDTTEVGRSKLCTLVELTPRQELPPKEELTPRQDGVLPKAGNELLLAIRFDRHAAGLNEVEIYDSIYNSGKVLVLASWAKPDAADVFRPADSPAATVRRRTVRVIRDYGMFDRRETPQFYPEVKRTGDHP